MSDYDELLEEARVKAEAFRSTAKDYIPKMYDALRHENPNISPEDAIDIIQKDCAKIWSKNTILHALPDEAKNKEKQKAGRLRQKEQDSAAFSAAPPAPEQEEEEKKIVVAAIEGKSIEEDIQITSDVCASNSSTSKDDATNANPIQAHLQNQESLSDLKQCSSCQDLHAKVIELSDALRKATRLTTADQISRTQISLIIPNAKYEEVRAAMESSRHSVYLTFDKNGILQRADPDILKEGN